MAPEQLLEKLIKAYIAGIFESDTKGSEKLEGETEVLKHFLSTLTFRTIIPLSQKESMLWAHSV